MIAVQLCGGLGNQLFQYAAGRQLAIRHGTELVLDVSDFRSPKRGETVRDYGLQCLRIQARLALPEESRLFRIGRRVPFVARFLSSWRPYREQGYGYNRTFEVLPVGTYLIGYWQSFKYFHENAAQIACELAAALPLSEANVELSAAISKREAVAVHVRRGDYVMSRSAANFHGSLSLSYYFNAMVGIRRRVLDPYFVVFSDDPEWCKENLPLGNAVGTYVSHNAGVNAWQDLMLMAQCHHHVIANSSFSWWGAWLADQYRGHNNRLVFAPKAWFKNLEQNSADRFPPHWIVL